VLQPLLARYPNHLVVDAGGWSERKEEQRVLATRAFLEGMELLGLQVANVAARDLLLGDAELQRLQGEAKVQLLSANIRVGGSLRFRPYVLLQKRIAGQRVRIGIAGVTAPSQLAMEEWDGSGALEFTDPLAAAREVLETLRPQTDVRILLAHLPLAELEDFARAEPAGFDLFVTSTGELRETTPVGATPAVLAPGTQAKHLAWVYLRTPRPGATAITGGEVLALAERIADAPALAAHVAAAKERLQAARGVEPQAAASHVPEAAPATP
jgi:2',3'-cyclic-nucleotide 2'-phosphodiesterase (5'-nucleotidase family)